MCRFDNQEILSIYWIFNPLCAIDAVLCEEEEKRDQVSPLKKKLFNGETQEEILIMSPINFHHTTLCSHIYVPTQFYLSPSAQYWAVMLSKISWKDFMYLPDLHPPFWFLKLDMCVNYQ